MKRGVVCIAIVLMAFASPALAPAQGFLGGGFPGLPSLGGFLGSSGDCDPCSSGSPLSLTADVGVNYQAVNLAFTSLGAGTLGIFNYEHYYRFGGVNLGLTATAVSPQGFGGMLNFSILGAVNGKDSERYDETAPFIVGRNWSTKNDTYSFTGIGFYNVFHSAALLGGFRWDHMETSFLNPDHDVAIMGARTDESVLIVNIYQPFLGVLVDQGGPSRVLRFGLYGWPQLYGSVRYEETVGGAAPSPARIRDLSTNVSDGYFWEIFGEYGLKNSVYGAGLSAYAKWTQYHVRGTLKSDVNFVGAGTVASDRFDISIYRNSWTVGANLSIPLALPLPW